MAENNLIGPLAKSFVVYIGTCLLLDRIRKSYPEYIIQDQTQTLNDKAKCNTIQTALINLSVGAMILFFIGPYVRITAAAPSNTLFFVEFLKLAAMFFVSDTMFYWTHRLMHIPWVYKVVHKQHHSHQEPIPWTSLYVHPLEFLIALMGIFLVPLLLFSMHPVTATLFLSGVMLSLVVSHCGLKLGKVFVDSTHHDLHHQMRIGNYGSNVGIWDKVCETHLA
jgi:sterol desaturase/sphingolipid hydroxylase (fatty acid hydroxylase superfamily)